MKLEKYALESLAATGFCVVSANVAFKLRPDIFITRLEVGMNFNDAPAKKKQLLETMPGVKLLEAEISGEWMMVATRSEKDIANRVEHIVGIPVTGVRPIQVAQPVAKSAAAEVDPDPCPAWACADRAEWHRKRGMIDIQFPTQKRAKPQRARF